ncbi:MAG TPA: hypothetical protein VM120_05340 [Bryobacteraceae bacterium]|nr:hypothetical protein [Bryobacteraceae bacterium]
MNLGAILSRFKRIPSALEELRYEHRPVDIIRKGTREDVFDIPGIDGGPGVPTAVDLPTDQIEQEQVRTGAPSKFGTFVKQGLPAMLRAGIVAAGSPTPGQVGTAGDIFGALRVVEGDQNNRNIMQMEIQRRHRQEAMQDQMQQAKLGEVNATAGLRQAQAEAVRAPKPSKLTRGQEYDELYRRAFDVLGDPLAAHNHAMSGINRNSTGFIKLPPKTSEAALAELEWQHNNGDIGKDVYLTAKQRLMDSLQEASRVKSFGAGAGNLPFRLPITGRTPDGKPTFLGMELMPDSNGNPAIRLKPIEGGLPPPEKKPVPRSPWRPRRQVVTTKDGKVVVIDPDNPQAGGTLVPGVERPLSFGQQQIDSLFGPPLPTSGLPNPAKRNNPYRR